MGKYNVEGLRAVKLLRVSTDNQTNKDTADIPTQRQLVDGLIKEEGLIVVKEFVEGGISGSKLSANERDALIEIRKMAERKEFDVLVVYLSDRIGRQAYESPMVIEALNKMGIRVIATDGELKTTTGMDKFFTFLKFWQSSEEASKISQRSSDYLTKAIENGQFKGGGERAVPLGYKLIPEGRINTKGKKVSDIAIDEEDSKLVRLIFDLSIKNNMGSRQIANYLNENGYKSESKFGAGWRYTTIDRMFKNITYKGYLHMYNNKEKRKIISPLREDLIIIPEEEFDYNLKLIEQRRRNYTKTEHSYHSHTGHYGMTNSRVLLSGLVYCGHCGQKMYAWANHKKRILKDGTIKKTITDYYRCKSKESDGLIKCNGKGSYSAKSIEEDVIIYVKEFVSKYSEGKYQDTIIESIQEQINELNKRISYNNSQYEKLKEEEMSLLDAIPRAITGKFVLSVDDLNTSLQIKRQQMKEIEDTNIMFKDKIDRLKISLFDQKQYNKNILTWKERYDQSTSIEQKKALLNEIINKVIITKEKVICQVKIKFSSDLYSEMVV